MSVKTSFEIGHTASVRAKLSPEGFTHDWELHVRGADACNITRFVDKVVFNLHESFPKPKRSKSRICSRPIIICAQMSVVSFQLSKIHHTW